MSEDFRLGDWIVRPQRRIVERGDQSIHIKPKPMSVLQCLATAEGEPVSRNELFDVVWPGGEVSDETLTKCVVELRKAFGDTAKDSRIIETIPKMGFRLVPAVEPLEEEPITAVPPHPERQQPGRARPKLLRWDLLLLVVVLCLGLGQFFRGSLPWLNPQSDTSPDKKEQRLASYYLEQKPGIAVLPFVNMSSDPENEYFSDGMSEEILNALVNTDFLPVIARTSSFQFKGDNRDIKEIGRLLGVTHVLEGSVRKSGDSVRVTAQLVDAITGMHVWSKAYQREWSDIFILQNELTKNIVEKIGVVLGDQLVMPQSSPPGAEFMTVRRTADLEAYELYLKGMQMLASTSPKPIEQAAGYFDRAIALDGDYADAWAAKGRALYVLGRPSYGHSTIPAAIFPEAIAAFKRALEIEPEHAFAMGWLGMALIHNDYKWAEGMQLVKQSLALNPNDAALLSVYGSLMKTMRIEGAEEILERAFHLDPFGIVPITLRAFSLAQDGRMMDALVVMETSLIGDRDGYAPNSYVGFFNIALGRLDIAEKHYNKARLVAHSSDLNLDLSGWIIAHLRGEGALPWDQIWERAQTERWNFVVTLGMVVKWENEKAMVAAYDLTIAQRHPELLPLFFAPKPALMPIADWHRMKEITGIRQFQSTR